METNDGRPGASSPASRGARIVVAVRGVLCAVGALALLSALLLMTADVAGREILNNPIYGAYELVELMMSVIVFAGLPLVTGARGHVAVTLIRIQERPRFRPWMPRIIHLMSMCALAAIAWRLWEVGASFGRYDEVTMGLRIPLAPIAIIASALTAVAALAVAGLLVLNPPPAPPGAPTEHGA